MVFEMKKRKMLKLKKSVKLLLKKIAMLTTCAVVVYLIGKNINNFNGSQILIMGLMIGLIVGSVGIAEN